MPRTTDKERMRKTIMESLEQCIDEKPLSNITLRDIAQKAGITHPLLLQYYKTKKDLFLAYCGYTRDYMTTHCAEWFDSHDRAEYPNNVAYLNAFMAYVAKGKPDEKRPNATVQTYVLAHYDAEIDKIVKAEFVAWRAEMEQCLRRIYPDGVGSTEAEAMMVLISGIFICHYTGALTGNIDDDYLSEFAHLLNR